MVALNAVNVFYLRFQQNFNQDVKNGSLLKYLEYFRLMRALIQLGPQLEMTIPVAPHDLDRGESLERDPRI